MPATGDKDQIYFFIISQKKSRKILLLIYPHKCKWIPLPGPLPDPSHMTSIDFLSNGDKRKPR